MNRREQERGRRPPKRSRSPEERDHSLHDDKRRRSYANERKPERSLSPRPARNSSGKDGRDERHHRRDERRERDSRSQRQGTHWNLKCLTYVDESHRHNRDRKSIILNAKPEPDAKLSKERTPPPTKPSSSVQNTPKTKAITASALLEEEEDPSLSKLMGFTRFKSTKGKKHEDWGAVDLIQKRTYRQYMNRPGGFNRPLDQG